MNSRSEHLRPPEKQMGRTADSVPDLEAAKRIPVKDVLARLDISLDGNMAHC